MSLSKKEGERSCKEKMDICHVRTADARSTCVSQKTETNHLYPFIESPDIVWQIDNKNISEDTNKMPQ